MGKGKVFFPKTSLERKVYLSFDSGILYKKCL
jgi:hypothetical protein